jgi:hypothetical protein
MDSAFWGPSGPTENTLARPRVQLPLGPRKVDRSSRRLLRLGYVVRVFGRLPFNAAVWLSSAALPAGLCPSWRTPALRRETSAPAAPATLTLAAR